MTLNIGRILKARKMRAAQLADTIGISRGYLSELISGKKEPSPKMLVQIADALGVSPAELYEVATTIASPQPPRVATGFSEDATAYMAEDQQGRTVNQAVSRAVHAQRLIANRNMLGFAILKGDEIIIDIAASTPARGLVAVTRVDLNTGSGVTLIRRIEAGKLFSDEPMSPPDEWEGPDFNFAVMGKVVGIAREF